MDCNVPTMTPIQMPPQRYMSILGEYDAILAHARAMSDRLAGRRISEKHLSYAETIFTKLLCHASSLQKLAPTLQPTSGPELWDIGAACVLARTLIEAFDALAYVSLHPVPPIERELRILAWELHDKEHRLHMLEDIGARDSQVESVRADARMLRDMVTAHPAYAELPKELRKAIEDGKAPAFLRSKRDRNMASGINHDYYNAVTMYLSQYVHTFPFALSHLTLTHAGDPGALQLISMPLQYSMSFLAKAIVGIGSLWPDTQLKMSGDLRIAVDAWLLLAGQGVKDIGRETTSRQ